MKSDLGYARWTRGLVLILSCLLIGFPARCNGAAVEKTPAELINFAKNPQNNPMARVSAIEKLGNLSEAGAIRDNKVVDELIAIARVPDDDIFVRQAAIKADGKLYTVDKTYKERYLAPFMAILKDQQKEHYMVRKAVAEVFRDTLVYATQLHSDYEAYKVLLGVAMDKKEVPGLRYVAINAIGRFGAPEGLDDLSKLLGEQDQLIRENAAGALYDLLTKIGGFENLPVPIVNKLIEMVGDKKMAPELRVNVMKVLAQLIRGGQNQAKQVMPLIVDFVTKERNVKLVEGGIEALGIIGSAEAIEPLKVAYADYLASEQHSAAAAKKDDAAAGAEAAAAAVSAEKAEGTRIRGKIMEALVSVLSFQTTRRQSDMKAVHECALLLVKVLDEDPSATVKEAAVFAMRYLYPAKFGPEHKEAIDVLIYLMLQRGTSDELKEKIAKTLSALTGQDFGPDAKRWDVWFTDRFKMRPRVAPQPKAAPEAKAVPEPKAPVAEPK